MLTPVYDVALEVLGFGRSFKATVAELAQVKPGEVKRGETVLDVGCGTGTLLHALVAGQPEARSTGSTPTLRRWPSPGDVCNPARRRWSSSRATPRTYRSPTKRSSW